MNEHRPDQRDDAGEPPEASETLRRATDALRESDEPGWQEIAETVAARLRSAARPAVDVLIEADERGSTAVSSRVLAALLVDRVDGPDVVVESLRWEVDAGVLDALEVDVTVAYGTDAPAIGDRVVATARALFAELGLTTHGSGPRVHVAVVDVAVGDPRR